MKERLDVLLVKKGLASSREKAKVIIMSGQVYVNNEKEDKRTKERNSSATICFKAL